MILVDLNNVVFGRIVIEFSNQALTKDHLRHIILDTLQTRILKHRKEYGDVIIAKDGKNYWRKKIFPYYKQQRKAQRDKSIIDWVSLFGYMDELAEEFKVYLPYPFVTLNEAEADDVIYCMIVNLRKGEKTLILSGDKDLGQLQRYEGVSQYNPNQKTWVEVSDPNTFLQEHIFRGDASDGVPNILSQDSCFVSRIRQTTLRRERVSAWIDKDPRDVLTPEQLRNYHRNKTMIDLNEIPFHIQDQIAALYEEQANKQKMSLYKYFHSHRLKGLMESINDF